MEKAASIEELRDLREPYLEAVLKAKGNEMARSLKSRLDQLLYLGETVPNTTIIGLNVASGVVTRPVRKKRSRGIRPAAFFHARLFVFVYSIPWLARYSS